MIDKEILTVEDIADILGFDAAKVRAMLEDGSFPGRQIAGEWFTTKRQFLDYIENGLPKAAEEAPATKNRPAPTKFRSNIGTNAWECKACNALNEALRAECLSCGYARSMPLIDFASHSLPTIEIPEDMN